MPEALTGRTEDRGSASEARAEVSGASAVVPSVEDLVAEVKRQRASLRAHDDVLENATDLIQSIGPSGEVLYANKAWRETLGYRSDELASLNVFDLIAPDSLEHCQEVFAALGRGEECGATLVTLVARDGTPQMFEARLSASMHEGRLVNTRGVLRALAGGDLSAYGGQALEAVPTALIVADRNGLVTFMNDAACVLTGWSAADVIGRQTLGFWADPAALATLAAERVAAPRRGVDSGTAALVSGADKTVDRFLLDALTPSGSQGRFAVSVAAARNPIGFHLGYVLSLSDVTASEELLRTLSERLLSAATSGKVGLWEIDRRSGAQIWSEQCFVSRGLDPDRRISPAADFYASLHPDDRERVLAERDRLVPGVDHRMEFRVVRPDGEVRHLVSIGRLEVDAGGEPVRRFGTEVDVTEQVRAEAELHRFRESLEAVFAFDPETLEFVYVNRGARVQTGYSESELLGLHPYDLDPGFTESSFRELLEPLANGAVDRLVFETVHRHRDGRLVPVESYLQKVSAPGQAGGFLSIVRDITERVAAREAQAQALELMETVIRYSEIPMALHDGAFTVLLVNPAMEELSGVPASEQVGFPPKLQFVEPLTGERLPVAVAYLQALAAAGGDVAAIERWVERPDGSRVFARATARVIRGATGVPEYYLAQAVDVTEELSVRDRERLQTLVLEGAGAALIASDPKGVVSMFNAQAVRMFGYAESEVLGLLTTEALYAREELEARAEALSEQFGRRVGRLEAPGLRIALGLEDSTTQEWTAVRKDGSRFPVEMTLSAFRDETETIVGWLGVILDISERVAQRRQIEAAASEAIAAASTLARANGDLLRSNRDLETFAYAASHDLLEPLRGISNCADLLVGRNRQAFDAKSLVLADHLLENADRMRALILDLLAFSRLGRGGDSRSAVRLDNVLAAAQANLSLRIGESGAVITHDPLPTVHGNRAELVMVLQNLLSNAIKFRSDRPPRIHLSAEWVTERAKWVISVADNGIGIDPAHHDRVFGMFERLHSRGEFPGTGIGLAMCKRIVESHGGEIWVASTVDEGTTVSLSLLPEGSRGEGGVEVV